MSNEAPNRVGDAPVSSDAAFNALLGGLEAIPKDGIYMITRLHSIVTEKFKDMFNLILQPQRSSKVAAYTVIFQWMNEMYKSTQKCKISIENNWCCELRKQQVNNNLRTSIALATVYQVACLAKATPNEIEADVYKEYESFFSVIIAELNAALNQSSLELATQPEGD